MASNPLFMIPDFLHFPNELCFGYLRFEGNPKFTRGVKVPCLMPIRVKAFLPRPFDFGTLVINSR